MLKRLKPDDTIEGAGYFGVIGPLHGTPLLVAHGMSSSPPLPIEITGHMHGELQHRPFTVTDEIPGHTAADLLSATSQPAGAELLHTPATQPATIPSSASEKDGLVFYPLYVSQLGKGRIVNCQWHNQPPSVLDPDSDGIFYLHCVQWLAHRPIE